MRIRCGKQLRKSLRVFLPQGLDPSREIMIPLRQRLRRREALLALAFATLALPALQEARAAGEPLPSWNDTPPKKALITFVERVTKEGSPDFVPVRERIATFDNDGTLWAEQPIYVQFQFAFDRVKALAPQHPEWKTKEPFNH